MSGITNEEIAMIQTSVFLASKKRVSVQEVVSNFETFLTILTSPPWSPPSDVVIDQDEDDPVY